MLKNKGIIIVAGLLLAGGIAYQQMPQQPSPVHEDRLFADWQRLFEQRQSDVQVVGEAVVSKILRDDVHGVRHQKFIVTVDSGMTLLISHNIDLAPRIDNLQRGDTIRFSGEYEWNPKGGVIHWTHHDPAGKHASGWIEHNGRLYQ
ncbi:MAG: DUF3465 domain-containing protein [Chromatiales bacterium]|jgi:hypothetical protein